MIVDSNQATLRQLRPGKPGAQPAAGPAPPPVATSHATQASHERKPV